MLTTTFVSEVMRPVRVTADPDASTDEVMALAEARDSRHVLVVDRKELVGILCTCDLCDVASGVPIDRVMSAPVETADAELSIEEAATRMRERGFGALPIVRGGLVVGIVTRSDLRECGLSFDDVDGDRVPDQELGGGD